MVRFGCERWQCRLCLSWCSLSSNQSGEPDAGCQLSPRVDHGGTHRSTLNVAGPGGPVSGPSRCQPGQPEHHPVRGSCVSGSAFSGSTHVSSGGMVRYKFTSYSSSRTARFQESLSLLQHNNKLQPSGPTICIVLPWIHGSMDGRNLHFRIVKTNFQHYKRCWFAINEGQI